jgi:hypothetical protein
MRRSRRTSGAKTGEDLMKTILGTMLVSMLIVAPALSG